MSNPEDGVIDAIDALVDAQMAGGEPYSEVDDICPHCGGSWHGLAYADCPGACASADEVAAWREREYGPPPGIQFPIPGAPYVAWSDPVAPAPMTHEGQNLLNELMTHLIGELAKVLDREILEVMGLADGEPLTARAWFGWLDEQGEQR